MLHVKTGEYNTLITNQTNLQRQNLAALMSRRLRAVEHRKCAAGLPGAHPGLQDRMLLN